MFTITFYTVNLLIYIVNSCKFTHNLLKIYMKFT